MYSQLLSESVPPRKRRRPALSCIECRRRKIKCDRRDPCNHCTKSKSTSCTYKDGGSSPANAKTKSTVASSSVRSQENGDLGSCGFVVPFVSDGMDEETSNPYPRTTPLFHESLSNSSTLYSPSTGSPAESHSQSDSNAQVLTDRVKNFENGLNTVSAGNLDPSWTALSLKNNTTFFGDNNRVLVPELRGSVSKTRLFGQSHWMSSFENFTNLSNFRRDVGIGTNLEPCIHAIKTSEIKTLLEKCKAMARAGKAEYSSQWQPNPSPGELVPSREIADKLSNYYLTIMESNYRILHIPSFQREYEEYWNDPQTASSGFIVKLLLVLAIGTTFYQDEDFHAIRSSARQWVRAAQSWMSAPFEKGRLNLSGLQVHCLIIVARRTAGVDGDLVWISVGSLVRMAITMGFHRDPKLFPRMTVLHAELRRRLWATVLELAVMTSFDSGNPALISPNDWDTEPPSNINDDEINETTRDPPKSQPLDIYTQTSLQIQLLRSIRTRLEASRAISDFRSQPQYDDILRLGRKILSFGREGILLATSTPAGSLRPSTLQRNLLDTPIRRVLLALHFPFAMKARTDPRFYFSRKVCLDAAVTILTYPSCSPGSSSLDPKDGYQDEYTRLKLVDAGFIKQTSIYASLLIQLELITQLEEESPLLRNEIDRRAREPLRSYLAQMIELTAQRITLGENNIKGHLFLSAVSAQIDALEKGIDPDPLIAKAAKESAELCYGLLKMRIRKPPSSVVMENEIHMRDALGGQEMEFGVGIDGEFAFEYLHLMPDANFDFEVPDSWLFEGLNEW